MVPATLSHYRTEQSIIFDGSAKFGGISFNDIIIKDRNCEHIWMMFYTRHLVAFITDIAEMYLRIKVAAKDRSCQWLLWRSLGQQRKPQSYEFNWVVFGINSSSFQVQFVFKHMLRSTNMSHP